MRMEVRSALCAKMKSLRATSAIPPVMPAGNDLASSSRGNLNLETDGQVGSYWVRSK